MTILLATVDYLFYPAIGKTLYTSDKVLVSSNLKQIDK